MGQGWSGSRGLILVDETLFNFGLSRVTGGLGIGGRVCGDGA